MKTRLLQDPLRHYISQQRQTKDKMIILTEKDLEYEWGLWGDTKPWQCSKCRNLLASGIYESCNGMDEYMPKDEWAPHDVESASVPLTFEQFSLIVQKWFEEKTT